MTNNDRGRARMAAALGKHPRIEIIRFLHCAPKRGSGLLRSVDLLWESPAN